MRTRVVVASFFAHLSVLLFFFFEISTPASMPPFTAVLIIGSCVLALAVVWGVWGQPTEDPAYHVGAWCGAIAFAAVSVWIAWALANPTGLGPSLWEFALRQLRQEPKTALSPIVGVPAMTFLGVWLGRRIAK